MIKLTDEGLVTDEAQVAAMFLGETLDEGSRYLFYEIGTRKPGGSADFGIVDDEATEDAAHYSLNITIPYPLVKTAIQPVEGEAYIEDGQGYLLSDFLSVYRIYHKDERRLETASVHKRVLNIVTTRGELRELVAKCEEKV